MKNDAFSVNFVMLSQVGLLSKLTKPAMTYYSFFCSFFFVFANPCCAHLNELHQQWAGAEHWKFSISFSVQNVLCQNLMSASEYCTLSWKSRSFWGAWQSSCIPECYSSVNYSKGDIALSCAVLKNWCLWLLTNATSWIYLLLLIACGF